MPESLNIDGKAYNREGLEAKWTDVLSKKEALESDRDIWHFIKQWFDDGDHIKVMTSGSTGSPTTKLIPKRWMIASATATAEALDLQAGQSAFLCLSAGHIGGMMMIVRSIEVGMRLFTSVPSRRPEPIQKMDFTAMVPMQVRTLLETGVKLSNFGTIIIGGAPLDAWTERQLKSVSTPVYATFGMTETVSHIALRKLNGEDSSSDFTTLPNVLASSDSDGRLMVEITYMDRLKVNSNDLVAIKDKHHFTWRGRFDNIINSGGIKINPEAMEWALAELMEQNFFIHKEPHPTYGEIVVLCLEGTTHNIATVKTAILSIHDSRTHPKVVYLMDRFIRTETGKLRRNKTFSQEKRRLD